MFLPPAAVLVSLRSRPPDRNTNVDEHYHLPPLAIRAPCRPEQALLDYLEASRVRPAAPPFGNSPSQAFRADRKGTGAQNIAEDRHFVMECSNTIACIPILCMV